jgi:hypothetical protein
MGVDMRGRDWGRLQSLTTRSGQGESLVNPCVFRKHVNNTDKNFIGLDSMVNRSHFMNILVIKLDKEGYTEI